MRKFYTLFSRYFLVIFLFTIPTLSFAQKEWSNWYYNGRNLLTFKNGFAEFLTDFVNPKPAPNDFFHFYNIGSGGISYSDPKTGDMKFIISNRYGFNRNYDDFPNDNALRSCPDKFSYHIIPFQNNPDKFYIIQFQDYSHDRAAQETGLQVRCPNAIGLGYSIVDLSLDGGLGDFTIMNKVITAPITGQITTVRHANGKDVWVIVHPYNSSKYNSFLVTDAGIQPAVESTVGPFIGGTTENILGTLTASHDGKLLAGVAGLYSGVPKEIQLFDFNNATGIISNYKTLPFKEYVTKIQFSPDNSKLYVLGYESLYQYDFNKANVASTLTRVVHQPNGLMYDMQLAPDGKIYVTKLTTYINNEYNEYIGAVQCPNLPQYACNFNPTVFKTSQISFPDLINDFINDPKAPPITKFNLGNDTAICFGDYKIKAPNGWESYKWNTGETTQEITVKKPGLYYVLSGSTGFSCPQGYGYINILDKAIKLNLGKDTSLCPKTPYLLHINNEYSNIMWQNGSSTHDSLIRSGSSIIISANDRNGCFTNDTINVSFKFDPRANFGRDTTLCFNQTLLLQLEPRPNPFGAPGTFLWQNGSVKDTFRVTQNGTYWGQVTYQGCTVRDTINVSFVNAVSVTLGRDTTLCSGDSLRLQTNIQGGTYLWSTGEKTPSIIVSKGGNYWVSVNNGSCSVKDTINITFQPKPVLFLGKDTSLCENELLTLHATANSNYLWQDNSTKDSLAVNTSGSYWVQVTKNGCSIRDTIIINYKPLPQVNLGKDTGICINQNLLLNVADASIKSYLWQDNSQQASFTVTQAGMYNVIVTGVNGCKNSDTILVKIFSNPVVTLDRDSTLCSGTTRILNAGNFTSYLWNTGNTSQTISVNNAGIYSVTVTDNNNCKGSDTTKIVTLFPSPSNFLPADTAVCSYGSVQLSSKITFSNYLWNTNAVTPAITVTQPGVYWLQVTDKNNCSGRDSISVAQKDCMKGFYIPNAFSPNKDGKNDLFRPMLFGKVMLYEFAVYNQWGEIVFKSTDVNKGWDGTYKKLPQDTFVFVWTCKYQFENEPVKTERGTVTLVR